MQLNVHKHQDIKNPEVTITYCEMTPNVKRVINFVRSVDQTVLCRKENEVYTVSVLDIFYVESIDKKTFVYCENDVFQCNLRLYELETLLIYAGFVRVSKSIVLNIEKLKGIKTLVNSRLEAILSNGERVYVTRKYLKGIREELLRRNCQ